MKNENLIYRVNELLVDNDKLMKFKVLLDITDKAVIVEGWYKLKLDGMSNFKKIAEKVYKIDDDNEKFDTIVNVLYTEVIERVEFAKVVTEFFKDRDHVEIVT